MGCPLRQPYTYLKGKVMKRKKEFKLESQTDIKVFLMFLLDNINRPVDYTTVSEIIMENVDEVTLDYENSLRELADDGHLLFDEIDGEKYYMISESGRKVASELYDTLDPEFREKSIHYAIKHVSLSESGAKIKSYVTETENNRFKVTLEATGTLGALMSTSITVNSRSEAEMIKKNYDSKPDAVYRGILFALTGRLEYIS